MSRIEPPLKAETQEIKHISFRVGVNDPEPGQISEAQKHDSNPSYRYESGAHSVVSVENAAVTQRLASKGSEYSTMDKDRPGTKYRDGSTRRRDEQNKDLASLRAPDTNDSAKEIAEGK